MAKKVCTICEHPRVGEINAALVGREQLIRIAATFGIHRSSLTRHREHVIEMRGLPREPNKGSDAGSITEQVLELEEELKLLLATARRTKNRKDQLTIIDKLMGMIEFRAKLSGAVKPQKPSGAAGNKSDRSEGFHGDLDQLIERQRRLATKPS